MSETGPEHFLDSTEEQARRVLEAEVGSATYDQGIAFLSLAMGAQTVQPQGEYLPEVPAGLYLVWGSLTDEWDAPGRGSPEQDAAAVAHMKKAAAEWLVVSRSAEARSAYLDRWVHDECGYARGTL